VPTAPPPLDSILGRILARKREEVAALARRTSRADLEASAREAPATRSLAQALRRGSAPRPRVIAEFKRASPSAGVIREGANPALIATDYEAHGAAALSVLTDRDFFGGSLSDLTTARVRSTLPALRKDFIVDPLQVIEARAAAADAVLLIAAALGTLQMQELHAEATRLGMDVLVEVHAEDELERALRIGATIVGVNHRDLRTFQMDLGLSARLRRLIPGDKIMVAESGLRTRADVDTMAELGVDAILVGEAFMRAASPGAALAELCA
jgi:indole-3-glycerol phosphate synthase